MSTFLTVIGIYLAGWVLAFRLDAWQAIKHRNKRREEAITGAVWSANRWPLLTLGLVAVAVHSLLIAGLPKSQADRDAELAELEREALGDDLEARMSSALQAAVFRERESRKRESRRRTTRSRRRTGDDREGPVCADCGVDVVPGEYGFIHTPSLGGPTPCTYARVDRPTSWRRHLDEHHRYVFERCPVCWPMLP